jgi:hypothetical protein
MNVPSETRNCPYCLNPVGPDDDKVRCPKCGVTHHAECWKTNGRCSVYGCDGWAAWSDSISDRIAPTSQDAVIVDETPKSQAPDVTLCIRCGAEVGRRQMLCHSCSWKAKRYRFEYCLGPGVIILGGVIGGIVMIVKAILT